MSFAEVRAGTPDSEKSDYYIATVDEQIGYIYYSDGLADRAIAALENASKGFSFLIENEPFNRLPTDGLKQRHGKVLVKLSRILEYRAKKRSDLHSDDTKRAEKLFQKAVELMGGEAYELKRKAPDPIYGYSYDHYKADKYYAKKTGT